MILTFSCKLTQAIYEGKRVPCFVQIESVATRKLQQLDSAVTIDFLSSPPGNRLEALCGNRQGQCSIRINDQYRLCFIWTDQGVMNVEIVDYH
jgi:proteic killer suppression protein